MESQLLLFILVTMGSLITSLTGLGGGSLILAGLLMVYPPTLAIPLHSFTQLTANALRATIFFRKVSWRVVFAYASLMLPFAWLAAGIFEEINPSWLKVLVGSFILISIIPWRFGRGNAPRLSTFVAAGALSGFMGIFVGAVGPMVTPFFNRLNIGREGNISTKSAGQMFLQLSKIIAFSGAAGINFIDLKDHVGVLIAGTLLGVAVSIPLSRQISDQKFDLVVNLLLGLIAFKVIIEGVRELAF